MRSISTLLFLILCIGINTLFAQENVSPTAKAKAEYTLEVGPGGTPYVANIDNHKGKKITVPRFHESKKVTLSLQIENNFNSSATTKAIVVDKLVPDFKTKDFTLALDCNGQALISVKEIADGFTGKCLAEKNLDITQFNCSNIRRKSRKHTS